MKAQPAAAVVEQAIGAGVFPSAVAEVGSATGPLWRQPFGNLTFDADAPSTLDRTPFDLASLTKVIATTTLLMTLVDSGGVRLDDPVGRFFPEWRGADRQGVTVADLLEHASGLPARLVDMPPHGRREFEHEICRVRLEYEPRTQSIYSDLDFILLGFLIADRGRAPLDRAFDLLWRQFDPNGDEGRLSFHLAAVGPPPAPTLPLPEDRRRGRRLAGEVHDSYAHALGGVAGHAGLFGTAGSVGLFARRMLRAARGAGSVPDPMTPALVARFTTKSAVQGSSRALGWDTMLPTSSCGVRMSPSAFGHVGFTGTSVWIDPPRDRYFVLLTNRVMGGGTLDEMRAVRRAFHDACG